MQPAGDLGAGPAQVAVALGPGLQHCRVVIGPHLRAGRAQRHDGYRAGVVRVVLACVPGGQQAHSRAEFRLDVQDALARLPPAAGRAGAPSRGCLRPPRPAAVRAVPTSAAVPPARQSGPAPAPAPGLAAPHLRRSLPLCAIPCAVRSTPNITEGHRHRLLHFARAARGPMAGTPNSKGTP